MVENEAEKEIPSVGATLKAGRERRNFAVNDIANQLHLDTRIIYALEQDDFQALPDPIYVRGYIRNYCKVIGLEPDAVLEDFKQATGKDDPEIIPEIKYPIQSSSSDKPVKAFTWLIVLGLVVLLIAWWQSNFLISNDSDTAPAMVRDPALERYNGPGTEETDLDDDRDATPPGDTPEAIFIAPGGTGIATDTGMNSITTTDDSGLMPMQESGPQEVPSETLAADDSDIESTTDNGADDTLSATAGSAPAAAGAGIEAPAPEPAPRSEPVRDDTGAELAPAVGPDVLKLQLTADSWIEIFDTNDQTVYFDLGRTGDHLTLRGTAPFDILLGFAQGVSIEFNGKSVDPAPYTRAGVARFDLGE